ncbi:MAG: CoA-acylating methylmalonate-semialdehyde dehydrogenase [Thermoplasmata archaeon]|nr:CoA-acylating methylmalonate-semialdehyde dehydrogenase [Thermoplasmata archaeon]
MAAAGSPVLANFVDGVWLPSDGDATLDLPDPATNTILARVPLSSDRLVDAVVAAARRAFPPWSATPVPERARRLARFRGRLEEEAEELARTVVRENGKTLSEAEGSVRRGLEAAEFALSAPTLLQGSSLRDVSPGVDVETTRHPLGVVAGITPFNFPVMVPLWMAPMAIACGNTFVLKPSERAALSAQSIARLFEESGLPPGVFNLVHGAGPTAAALVAHPGVDAVAFVGSAPAAKEVYTRAAATGKRVLALAGAKNHLIVLPDADLDRTVPAIMSSAFGSAGERCLAASVVIAVEPVGEALVSQLAAKVRGLHLGSGLEPESEMGPVIRADHQQRVEEWIRRGERDGATLIATGATPEGTGGNFLAPVLFDRVRPEMALAQEEIFGPVLSVIRATSLAEAIDFANRSRFGNAASVFTRDGRSAREFSQRIEAGMVGINIGVPAPPAFFPFVGWKGSVYGDLAATGRESMLFYTRPKTVVSRWFPPGGAGG